VEASCSFNASVLGYIAILNYRSRTIVSNSTRARETPVILKGYNNGLHSVLVFPLLNASNLVGRRLVLRKRIMISHILNVAGQVGRYRRLIQVCYYNETCILVYSAINASVSLPLSPCKFRCLVDS